MLSHPFDATLALVPLTRGYFAVISAVDARAVGAFNWWYHGPNGYGYALNTRKGTGALFLHRFIADRMGLSRKREIDHEDGDHLNCRRSNLRPATKSQNSQNAKLRKDNTSGVKGVTWHAPSRTWEARITANKKSIFLGNYATVAEAAVHVNAARLALHGAFARLS